MTGWQVEWSAGPAAELHGRELPDPPVPVLWVHVATEPAIVLGSTQPEGDVDHAAAAALGIDVVRRRSGGGAVLLQPRGSLWIDVVVPATHPGWQADVGRAAGWMGEVWARALVRLGVTAPAVHHGPMVHGPLGRLVCFAGMGPGEVTVPCPVAPGGTSGRAGARAKLVGISQRRTREAARFQGIVHRRWDPMLQAQLLAPGLGRVAGDRPGVSGAGVLGELHVGVLDVPDEDVVEALHAELAAEAGQRAPAAVVCAYPSR